VLVEGDDHDEPVADAVRGILDGHLVLDRRIGERGRWPAVDVLRSVSRALPRCFPPDLNALVSGAREAISSFEGMAEMIRLGAYRSGSDPAVDRAIRLRPSLEAFLAQGVDERGAREEAFARLAAILEGDAPLATGWCRWSLDRCFGSRNRPVGLAFSGRCSSRAILFPWACASAR